MKEDFTIGELQLMTLKMLVEARTEQIQTRSLIEAFVHLQLTDDQRDAFVKDYTERFEKGISNFTEKNKELFDEDARTYLSNLIKKEK